MQEEVIFLFSLFLGGFQWMPPAQQVPVGCPRGLEYLTQLDQLLIKQQIELLEGMF